MLFLEFYILLWPRMNRYRPITHSALVYNTGRGLLPDTQDIHFKNGDQHPCYLTDGAGVPACNVKLLDIP